MTKVRTNEGVVPANCLPFLMAKDGMWMVDGKVISNDGVAWRAVDTARQAPTVTWPDGRGGWTCVPNDYIIKGVYGANKKVYMTTGCTCWSDNMTEFLTPIVSGSWMTASGCMAFFWKGKMRCMAPHPSEQYYAEFDPVNEWWQGDQLPLMPSPSPEPNQPGYQENIPYPPDEKFSNTTAIAYGDSNPNGTEVIGLRWIKDGEQDFTPVYLKDNSDQDGVLDSVESLPPLASIAGKGSDGGNLCTAIRYNETNQYWLAHTDSVALVSQPGAGNYLNAWTQTTLPYEKNWAPICWDGTKWITVSREPGDQLAIFSEDGINWDFTTDIPPTWSEDEGEADGCSPTASSPSSMVVAANSGVALFGLLEDRDPDTCEVTLRYRITPPIAQGE